MDYTSYKISRNLSWEILIDTQISSLPIPITTICSQLGIHLQAYSSELHGVDIDGESTIQSDGTPLILYNKDKPKGRKRFTVAHELGHILLGHVGKYELINREPSDKDNPIEQAANVFASRLLAPACVLWGCNARTAEDIARLCDISYAAAEFRMLRMQELYKRNKFLLAPLERQVYAQFQAYIMKNKL